MKRKLQLVIPAKNARSPIIYEMVTQYKLKPNILSADLSEEKVGHVVLEIDGTPKDVESGILYLKELGIEVENFHE